MKRFEINDKVKLNKLAYQEHPELADTTFANKILIIVKHNNIEPISYDCSVQGTDIHTRSILGIYLEFA